jgi:hypothetical protein
VGPLLGSSLAETLNSGVVEKRLLACWKLEAFTSLHFTSLHIIFPLNNSRISLAGLLAVSILQRRWYHYLSYASRRRYTAAVSSLSLGNKSLYYSIADGASK